MSKVLLIEQWGTPTDGLNKPLVETSSIDGALYIEGIFLQADVVNKNKRLYPQKVMEKAVTKYIKEQVETKQALGELNHPARPNVDPERAAILIEKLWWEGNNVMGRARVIEGDNSFGDKLAANIRAGWIPGVSSRGLGSLKPSGKGYNIVQEDFVLTVGVDVVWGPSAPNAYVESKRVQESVQHNAESDFSDSKLEVKTSLMNALNSIINK